MLLEAKVLIKAGLFKKICLGLCQFVSEKKYVFPMLVNSSSLVDIKISLMYS